MGKVLTITVRWGWLRRLRHKLFECPTFWALRPTFKCPCCGATYRCYWDGNDIGGKINVCQPCANKYRALGAWNEVQANG